MRSSHYTKTSVSGLFSYAAPVRVLSSEGCISGELKRICGLQTQDSAVAASFYTNGVPGQEAAVKTLCGIIQEIIIVELVGSNKPQLLVKVKWYKQALVADFTRIRAVPLNKCSGHASDFVDADVVASKETILM